MLTLTPARLPRLVLAFAALLAPFAVAPAAAATEGPIFDAIDFMIAQLTRDVGQLKDKRVVLANVTLTENLSEDVRQYLTRRIEGAEKQGVDFRFVQCRECMALRAETDGGQILVKRGITTQDELRKVTKSLGVRSYAEVNLAYTGTMAKMHVNSFDAQNSELKWSRSYESRVMALAKSGFKLAVTLGQMVGLDKEKEGYPAGVSVLAAERLYGVGQFGIAVFGSVKEGDYKSYYSIGPMVALNYNELAGSPWSWGAVLATFRLAYGWYAGPHRDVSVGLGTKLEIGSLYHVSLEALQGFAMAGDEEADDDAGDTPTYPPYGSQPEKKKAKAKAELPATIMLGFGFDVG